MNVIEADNDCLYIFSCVSESIKVALETENYCEENELDSMKFYHFENKQHSGGNYLFYGELVQLPIKQKVPTRFSLSRRNCVSIVDTKNIHVTNLYG